MVFWDGITQRFSGVAFFTGALLPDSPGSEISAFKTDNGETNKQRVTDINTAILKVVELHFSEISRVNSILSCDRLVINGLPYQNEEKPEVEAIKGTDLVKMNVKLFETQAI